MSLSAIHMIHKPLNNFKQNFEKRSYNSLVSFWYLGILCFSLRYDIIIVTAQYSLSANR